MKKRPSKEIRDYWKKLSWELGCVITRQSPTTIHHCRGIFTGMGQKTSDWLVIPLLAQFHTGDFGIDNGMGIYKGVNEWEKKFGKQAIFLDVICNRLDIDVWEMARKEAKS